MLLSSFKDVIFIAITVLIPKHSENITYTIENIACDDWTIADNCGTKEKFRTDELTIMARKDNKLNMKSIFINDCEYGLRRLKRKVERLKRRQENLEQIESLSLYGAEDLGRIKEAIYIYEDLIDIWEN